MTSNKKVKSRETIKRHACEAQALACFRYLKLFKLISLSKEKKKSKAGENLTTKIFLGLRYALNA